MKYLKTILMIVALIAFVVAGVLIGKYALDTQMLMGAAQRYDATTKVINPFSSMLVILAVGVGGAFLLGLGLGLPKRTAHAIRDEALDAATAQRQSAIQNRATGTETPR